MAWLSPQSSHPRSSAVLGCRMGCSIYLALDGASTEVVGRNQGVSRAVLSLPSLLCLGGKPAPTYSSFPQPPVSLPAKQGDSSPKCRNPGWKHPICGSHCSLLQGGEGSRGGREVRGGISIHILSLFLDFLPGAQVLSALPFFSSYLIMCESFLQPWMYKSLSASF